MRLGHIATILALAALPAGSEIIDRVVATVGDAVITQSELLLQMRVAAFLNGDEVDSGPAARRRAAERLIEQALIRREMELSRYPAPDLTEADAALQSLRKEERLATDEQYAAALARYRVTEEDLRQQLLWQLTVLRFIEYRFRPALAISEEDLNEYYQKQFLPRWKKFTSGEPPSLADSRAEIEKAVADRALDAALDRWLKQARAQTPIRFREEAFR